MAARRFFRPRVVSRASSRRPRFLRPANALSTDDFARPHTDRRADGRKGLPGSGIPPPAESPFFYNVTHGEVHSSSIARNDSPVDVATADSQQRILVTGYGGFLGTEIVRQLLARGHRVVGFGRGEYPHLDELPIDRICGDIRDAAAVQQAARGVDAVIHTAAVAGIWGPWRHYFRINTLGTEHVVRACQRNAVAVLVYCSSPSVTFAGGDQSGIDETAPYPQRWLCHYPHTKALGEQLVLDAHRPGQLHTLALRPHLIWGAEDPHLFPRLLERARRGKLRQIGDGSNVIDTVHVRNAAWAHVLAVEALRREVDAQRGVGDAAGEPPEVGGRVYFIAQDEPVKCWDWIAEVLGIAGVEMPAGRIGFRTAWYAGQALEWLYRATGRRSEPPMTRFLAAQLAKDHYFDISAARQRLGYRPLVSLAEGLESLRRAWRR